MQDAFENDDQASDAQPISLGEVQDHTFCYDLDDWMSFEAEAGKSYSLGFLGEDPFPPTLAVYVDPEGQPVEESESGFLTWTADQSRTYLIRVSLDQLFVSESYSIGVSEIVADLSAGEASSASSLVAGENDTFSVVVGNRSGFVSPEFDVALFLSTDMTVTTSDEKLADITIAPMEPETERYFDLDYTISHLRAPGTYYLAAIVDWSESVPEFIELNNVSEVQQLELGATQCAVDPYEDDDQPWTAQPAVLGQFETRNFCDDLDDWVSLEAQAGVTYIARQDSNEALVEVYDSDGSTLLFQNESMFNDALEVQWTPATSQTYYIRSSSTYFANLGEIDTYELIVDRALPDLEVTATEFSTFDPRPGGFLDINATVKNYLGFAAAPVHELGVYLSADSSFSPDDLLLSRHVTDAILRSDTGSVFADSPLPQDLTPGAYFAFAVADHDNAVQELDETNNVSNALPITVAGLVCTPDTFEPDDLFEQAAGLMEGVAQIRNQCEDQRDWAQFSAIANTPYQFQATWPSFSIASSVLDIYADDGTTLVAGPGNSNTSGRLFWRPPATGTYFLRVGGTSPASTSSSADYELLFDQCPTDAFEEDDAMLQAAQISVGDTQIRNFCDDEKDWARFDAVAGTTYTIETNLVGASANTRLRLLDEAGALIDSNSDVGGPTDARIVFTPPSSSVFYVEIDTLGWGLDSGYLLSLE